MRHEIHLVRRGLLALLAAAPLLVAGGAALGGGRGAGSVGVALVVVAVNQVLAAASIGWSRTLEIRVLALGYLMYFVRMTGVFAAFLLLNTLPWVHRPLLAVGLLSALTVALTAECRSYVRGTYVPSWRAAS